MSAALAPPGLPARLASAVGLLCRGLTASLPGNWGNAALTLLAWTRLRRLLARFAALAAAVEAGRFCASRRTAPGASRPRPARTNGSGWLLRLAPTLDTRIGRTQVESLLGDPDLAALLAQAPQAGRILRPLCHMLGIEAPAALRRPGRPRPRPARSGGTEAPAAGVEASPSRAARPPLPSWLTPPASPPPRAWPPQPKGAPALAPPHPAVTGPPGT